MLGQESIAIDAVDVAGGKRAKNWHACYMIGHPHAGRDPLDTLIGPLWLILPAAALKLL